jgi:hypothetical protein
MSRSRLRDVPHWMLVAIAIAAVLGHICALPHAHAGEPVAPMSHGHDDEADRSTPGDVHGASCEVVQTAAASLAAPACATVTAAPQISSRPSVVVRAPMVTARGPSPPLFLLHASLLI